MTKSTVWLCQSLYILMDKVILRALLKGILGGHGQLSVWTLEVKTNKTKILISIFL